MKGEKPIMCASPPSIHLLFLSPIWRSYADISSGAEAALAKSSSGFSLSSLEIANCPGVAGFALIERMRPDLWRWATVSLEGPILDEGSEPTQADAKISAVDALRHMMTLT
jgi:hypothetical protein